MNVLNNALLWLGVDRVSFENEVVRIFCFKKGELALCVRGLSLIRPPHGKSLSSYAFTNCGLVFHLFFRQGQVSLWKMTVSPATAASSYILWCLSCNQFAHFGPESVPCCQVTQKPHTQLTHQG